MIKSLVLFFAGLLLLSCKKDKLNGDKSVLVGNWKWVYSIHVSDYCTGDPPIEELITPDLEGYDYEMSFEKRGIVRFFENESFLEKKRIVFGLFKDLGGYYDFSIDLNNETDLAGTLNGFVYPDTIIVTTGFPFGDFREGCEVYHSYFSRQ